MSKLPSTRTGYSTPPAEERDIGWRCVQLIYQAIEHAAQIRIRCITGSISSTVGKENTESPLRIWCQCGI